MDEEGPQATLELVDDEDPQAIREFLAEAGPQAAPELLISDMARLGLVRWASQRLGKYTPVKMNNVLQDQVLV